MINNGKNEEGFLFYQTTKRFNLSYFCVIIVCFFVANVQVKIIIIKKWG